MNKDIIREALEYGRQARPRSPLFQKALAELDTPSLVVGDKEIERICSEQFKAAIKRGLKVGTASCIKTATEYGLRYAINKGLSTP